MASCQMMRGRSLLKLAFFRACFNFLFGYPLSSLVIAIPGSDFFVSIGLLSGPNVLFQENLHQLH